MIKKKEEEINKIEIDLTGQESNIFTLLEYVKIFCIQSGKDYKSIRKKMVSGGYENLIEVFDREFGSFVTLYR